MSHAVANSGIVHGGYDERHGTVKSQLAHRGNQLFHHLQRQLHFGFRVVGSLVVAFSPEEHESVLGLAENGRKNGVEGLQVLLNHGPTAGRLHELEPELNQYVYSALYCPHTGITSPYEYCIALAENAVVNGVQFHLKHTVTAIEPEYTADGQCKSMCYLLMFCLI